MNTLTDEQNTAVHTVDRPVCLIASAGTGKTSVLVARYLHLVTVGLTPKNILAVTFTNDAAAEMLQRIETSLTISHPNLVDELKLKAPIGTLHGFCHNLISEFGDHAGIPPVRAIRDSLDWLPIFSFHFDSWLQGLSEDNLALLMRYFSLQEVEDLAQQLFEKRHDLRELKTAGLFDTVFPIFEPLLNTLDLTRELQSSYSYDELESEALKLLRNHAAIRAAVEKKYQAVLVDEFQDVSHKQWEIIRLICADQWRRLFVVGDPKQSIYRFRNADIHSFFEAKRTIQHRSGLVLPLSQNFRTEPALLQSINEISAKLFPHADFEFSALTSRVSQNTATAARFLRPASPETSEVAGLVSQLLSARPKDEQIALLFRSSDKIPLFQEELKRVRIDASSAKRTSLWSSYEILDIISYLQAVLNPLDDYWMVAFLRSRFVGLGASDLQKLKEASGDTYFEKSGHLEHLRWFHDWIRRGSLHTDESLQLLFRNCDYFPTSGSTFLAFLKLISNSSELNIPTFISKLNLLRSHEIRVDGDSLYERTRVQLMTIHGSKGLEFDHVILCDTNRRPPVPQKRFYYHSTDGIGFRYRLEGVPQTEPLYDAFFEREKREEFEESKRVLYVAITRAKKSLTIVLPNETDKLAKGSWAELLQPFTASQP